MTYNPSKSRIVKNTAFLYMRTLLLLAIGVITSRITLQALGIDNYGIVNVVSGFVGMFSLVSGSLTAACQRFIIYELGSDKCDIRSVFSASMYIHIALCIIILILAETVGLYFVNHSLNLPDGRYVAVQWVYQCSILSFILSLINIPFNAMIIAHERMKIFAYISLLEVALKLIVVITLLYIDSDKLIIYALLGLATSIIVRITFQIYCHHAFGENIKLKRKINRNLTTQIFGFAGWSFFGNAATICSNQGVNIVINIFCGVTVNAARGIAVMVEGIITNFVTNFTTALNPQITKAYASNENNKLIGLMQLGFKITFFLMLVISVPVIISAKELLHVWFVDVPQYAVSFVRLTLLIAIVQAISNPFLTLLLATGKIKGYQLIAGVLTMMNLPLSYLLLYESFSPVIVYILNLIISSITFVCKLIYLKKNIEIKIKAYFENIILRLLICGITSTILSILYYELFDDINNIFKLFLFGSGSAFLTALCILFIGLPYTDRVKCISTIRARLQKV